ncbi:hypothetical protein [Amycolatopsis sp. NPDC098790]|uniref:hypothetical protein n=1 Tax=Amycolatopsis sp. NPDC098790 TaxID=3363939 RepID=UPI0037F52FC8
MQRWWPGGSVDGHPRATGRNATANPAVLANRSRQVRDLLDPERFVVNVHSAYAELTGVTTNRMAALADAVTWLGHPIRTKA